MISDKVDMYVITNRKFFPAEKIGYIKERLLSVEESKFSLVTSVELKDPLLFLIISIFLGCLGIDRFMLGDIAMGVLKLLTSGLCGILTIIDWCLITNMTKEANYKELMLALNC